MNLGPISFGEPSGLLWLGLLVPLILFYLIKPKPKVKEIPSLMFFMKASGRSRLLSFFRMFVHDFLFLVQLLLILLLALTASQPSININHDITARNTVIVLDSSASMQTMEGSETRFEKAVDAAKSALTTRNTVIVARNRPGIGVQEASSGDAAAYLNLAEPFDTETAIGDAIILAGEILRGKEGRVVVVSDFLATSGVEPEIAKAVLTSRGLVVNFINVAETGKNNVGFVDLVVEDDVTTAYIKNYNEQEVTVTLTVSDTSKQLTIPAKGVEPYVFKTLPNVAELTLTPEDHLVVDNIIRTSAPDYKPVKVLLITNTPSAFLQNALKASPIVELTIGIPPIIPKGDFDIIIIHNVNQNEVLPGTYDDLLKDVQNDQKTVIVTAQEESLSIDYRGLIPFGLTGTATNGLTRVENPTRFTKNIEFGKLPTYFTTVLQPGVISVAAVGNDTGVITVATVPGGGKLVYYGILEKGSDFKFSPYYPIFWHELIKYATNQKDIRGMNDKTGNTLLLDHETDVVTPNGKITTNRILFDKAGLYRMPERTIAVNLLSEEESDVNPRDKLGDQIEDVEFSPVKEKRKFEWEWALLLISLFLLFGELLYIKLRGDV